MPKSMSSWVCTLSWSGGRRPRGLWLHPDDSDNRQRKAGTSDPEADLRGGKLLPRGCTF